MDEVGLGFPVHRPAIPPRVPPVLSVQSEVRANIESQNVQGTFALTSRQLSSEVVNVILHLLVNSMKKFFAGVRNPHTCNTLIFVIASPNS
jgi:hypothetical protein